MKKFWEMKMSANKKEADIHIYGEVVSYKWDDTDTTSASFQKELKEIGDVERINLHINSPGGSVFEGIAIGNMLKNHKAFVTTYVDALAASIASVIAVCSDKVVMYENSMLMVHHPWTIAMGNAKDFRKQADDLDAIANSSIITYLAKAAGKLTEEKIIKLMDEETWLSANDALEIGLCDEILGENKIAASVSDELFQKYKNVPKQLTELNQYSETNEINEYRKKIAEASEQNKKLIKQELELL